MASWDAEKLWREEKGSKERSGKLRVTRLVSPLSKVMLGQPILKGVCKVMIVGSLPSSSSKSCRRKRNMAPHFNVRERTTSTLLCAIIRKPIFCS